VKDLWLRRALAESRLALPEIYPRDLITDVLRSLPVTIVLLPGLSTEAVHGWVSDRRIYVEVAPSGRLLHGCLLARAGAGIIFLDSGDSEEQRRFSLAHEIAHFTLDYLIPRSHAVDALGERILPVMDGERPATKAEALSSVLAGVALGTHVQLMARTASGAVCTWQVEEAEQRADRMAFELLAPAEVVLAELPETASGNDANALDQACVLVSAKFGIPQTPARTYIKSLLRARLSHSPTLAILGVRN
jgi:IrrE N-terminal-like domain